MLGTLRPLLFFGWIVALVTAIMVAFPFSTTAALDAKTLQTAVTQAQQTLTGAQATSASDATSQAALVAQAQAQLAADQAANNTAKISQDQAAVSSAVAAQQSSAVKDQQGVISAQNNPPRDIQFALKLIY